ncbi:MAG: signal recognition particle-docking protein FtsY [Candidatus Aminicenantales bacterium]
MIGDLKEKLSRTSRNFKEKFSEWLSSDKSREEILDELFESLILADVGVATTEKIIRAIKEKSKKNDSFSTIKSLLEKELLSMLKTFPSELNLNSSSSVIMFVGVNGGGKTTSLAKVAYHFKNQGKKVLMVAADTFRAAAQEQLTLWGKKLNIPLIKGQYGADPASIVYDALQSFRSHSYQLLLIDTAGRIHTNVNLMSELEKIKRVISREIEGAPQEILLVLDASIGQNALIQAKEFLKFSGITGIFLSKLDGTAKGGSVISIVDELRLPIKLVGIGESERDMVSFSAEDYLKALLAE